MNLLYVSLKIAKYINSKYKIIEHDEFIEF